MFFHVDESGHTGTNLFDANQPILYYGLLSSKLNIDILAKNEIYFLRKKLNVDRLHANELKNEGLKSIVSELINIQKKLNLRFDLYTVNKPDYAIISFFDQIFDQGVNPAMTWTGYWTNMRYYLLSMIANLFDDNLAKQAWAARIEKNNERSTIGLLEVCDELLSRLKIINDRRLKEIIGDSLVWARNNPDKIPYNADSKDGILQISPNLIGFQFVMLSIANQLKKNKCTATSIIVDQQTQFNNAQQKLATHYSRGTGKVFPLGPGLPNLDLRNMPTNQLTFKSGKDCVGLDIVDIYLWIFKRMVEQQYISPEIYPLIRILMKKSITNGTSLKGIAEQWNSFYSTLPLESELSLEQIKKSKELLRISEARRKKPYSDKK